MYINRSNARETLATVLHAAVLVNWLFVGLLIFGWLSTLKRIDLIFPGATFLVIALLGSALTSLVSMTLEGESRSRTLSARFTALAVVWLISPLTLIVPISLFSTVPAGELLLHGYSSWTTTGGWHLAQNLTPALAPFSAALSFAGGAVTLAGIVIVLEPSGVFSLEGARSHTIVNRHFLRAPHGMRITLYTYVAIGICGVVLLTLGGLDPEYSVRLAMNLISGGASLPPSEAFHFTGPPMALLVSGALMAFALLPLPAAIGIVRGDLGSVFRLISKEFAVLLTIFLLSCGVITLAVLHTSFDFALPALPDVILQAVFSTISLMSTTGIFLEPSNLTALPLPFVLLVVMIGGMTLSVSSGIKVARIRRIIYDVKQDLLRLLYPHLIDPRTPQNSEMRTLARISWISALMYLGSMTAVSLVLSYSGLSFEAAIYASLAALSNIYGVYGAQIEAGSGWPLWADLPAPGQCVLVIGMILGRLELLGILVPAIIFVQRFLSLPKKT